MLQDLRGAELALAEVEVHSDAASGDGVQEADFANLADTEAGLDPRKAVLSFLVAPEEDLFGNFAGGSWLLVTTRGGTRAYFLPESRELAGEIDFLLGLVENRDRDGLARVSPVLHDDLFGEAFEELPGGIEELVIVPDGALHLLPFGLLRPHPQQEPLAARFRISIVLSVTLWRDWGERPPQSAPAAVLALADPAFLSAGEVAGERLWALETGAPLGRLPHARREGRELMRRLGRRPSRLLLAEEAPEAALKDASFDRFGVLHFAAHVVVDERRPERSAVLLAPGGAGDDGLLQPHEIAALELSRKLVVLSACRSGSGQMLSGEGVQSLVRAFFRAGARAVVASLWRPRDDEAAAFFEAFYRGLAAGESVSRAIASARRERRAAGAPAAAWAAVVALGDGDLVPVPGGVERTLSPALLLSLAAGLILVAALLARRWRSTR